MGKLHTRLLGFCQWEVSNCLDSVNYLFALWLSLYSVSPVWVIAITKRNVCLVYRHKKLVTVNIHSYIEWGIVCVDHLCCLSAFSEAKDDFPFYLPDIDWEALTFSMICKTKLCPLTTLVLSSQNENAFFFFLQGLLCFYIHLRLVSMCWTFGEAEDAFPFSTGCCFCIWSV